MVTRGLANGADLVLPANYTEYRLLEAILDSGNPTQHFHMSIPIGWLNDNASINNIRVQGNEVVTWDRATRTIGGITSDDHWAYVELE